MRYKSSPHYLIPVIIPFPRRDVGFHGKTVQDTSICQVNISTIKESQGYPLPKIDKWTNTEPREKKRNATNISRASI